MVYTLLSVCLVLVEDSFIMCIYCMVLFPIIKMGQIINCFLKNPGVTLLPSLPRLFALNMHSKACKSGNFHGALSSSGQYAWRAFSGVCERESHVELQEKEVCSPLIWMKRMSSLALREYCSWVFFPCVCVSVLCFVSIALWFTHFLQPYVSPCNWLFWGLRHSS